MARHKFIPVAVVVQPRAYGQQVLRGVVNYVRQGAPWHFVRAEVGPAMEGRKSIEAEALEPRGVIAQLSSAAAIDWAGRLGAPVVNISGVGVTPFPHVGMDNVAIGAMAARHLIEKGYRHFACLCNGGLLYAIGRERGFRSAIEGVALSYRTLDRLIQHRPQPLAEQQREIRSWLRALPRPCGLFLACTTGWSSQAITIADVRCPEEVGIVGVGDDALDAEMHMPPLTTVDYPGVQIGFEAAQLLDRLMKGARPPSQPLLFPPTGVTVRQSTDVLVLADELVTNALKHIRQHLDLGLTVEDVAAHCCVSRRTLERRFSALRLSLGEEIRHAQVDRACKLLAETDMPLKQVALQSGLSGVRRLFKLIRRAKGTTPLGYRLQNAIGGRKRGEGE